MIGGHLGHSALFLTGKLNLLVLLRRNNAGTALSLADPAARTSQANHTALRLTMATK